MIGKPPAACGRRPPRIAVAVALACVLATASGCGRNGVTRGTLEDSLATTFAHLYVLQQQELGHPPVTVRDLQAMASCRRDAGKSWRCVVSWRVAGISTPAAAVYRVDASPDGKYVADGDGPRQVNGRHTLTTPGGGTATNPLWQFDGVVDTTSSL